MAKVSLERKLVDWAGHAKLAKLSNSDVQKAAKELGVSAADVKAAVAKLNATEYGGTPKRSNALEGSSHTKAPHRASGSLGFETMPVKVSIMLTNESAANIAIGAAKKAGEPVKIHLDDKGITLVVPPEMTHAEFFKAIAKVEEQRREQWAAQGAGASHEPETKKTDLRIPWSDLAGMTTAIRAAQQKGHVIEVHFGNLSRPVKVSPKTNSFDLAESIRMTQPDARKPDMRMPRADIEGMQAAIRTAQDKGEPISVFFENVGRVMLVSPKTNPFDLGEAIRMTDPTRRR